MSHIGNGESHKQKAPTANFSTLENKSKMEMTEVLKNHLRNKTRLNKVKCTVAHLGQNNRMKEGLTMES